MSKENFVHVPVLKDTLLQCTAEVFAGRSPGLLVDGTLGEAGHTMALHERFPRAGILALDRDPWMIERALRRLEAAGIPARSGGRFETGSDNSAPPDLPGPGELIVYNARFSLLGALLEAAGGRPDLILLDLGVSMFHFAGAARGFSYADESLDMRLDPQLERTAADLVNHLPEKELADLFVTYGEERFARRIAGAIARARPIPTARALAELIARSVPGAGRGERRVHPATRVFQALRIAVNEEHLELERALRELPGHLAPGGILAIIAFHSGEDRPVKQAFRAIGDKIPKSARRSRAVGAGRPFRILTDRPLRPSEAETLANPAARSARLRVIQKKADR